MLGSPAFYRDPYPTYRALLDSGKRAVRVSPPIVAVPQYRDCTEVIRDARLSAARQQRQMAHFDEEQKRELSSWTTLLENTMIFVDPPEHTRVRKLLHRAFSPEALAALVPRIEAIFEELLNALPVGEQVDFMSRLAHRFPALVVGEILGVPRSDWEPLLRWSDSIAEFVASLNAPIEVARKAQSAARWGSCIPDVHQPRRCLRWARPPRQSRARKYDPLLLAA